MSRVRINVVANAGLSRWLRPVKESVAAPNPRPIGWLPRRLNHPVFNEGGAARPGAEDVEPGREDGKIARR